MSFVGRILPVPSQVQRKSSAPLSLTACPRIRALWPMHPPFKMQWRRHIWYWKMSAQFFPRRLPLPRRLAMLSQNWLLPAKQRPRPSQQPEAQAWGLSSAWRRFLIRCLSNDLAAIRPCDSNTARLWGKRHSLYRHDCIAQDIAVCPASCWTV